MSQGMKTWVVGRGSAKLSGMTPTTFQGAPSMTRVRPTTAGSAAKRSLQRPWLNTSTRSPPA